MSTNLTNPTPATSIPPDCIYNPTVNPPQEHVYFQGLVSEQELVVWVGREKDRKTTVTLNLACCAALGRDFLGFRFAAPEPLRVVIFDYESKAGSLHRRYKAICAAMRLSEAEGTLLSENLKIIQLRKLAHMGHPVPRFETDEAFWAMAVKEHEADLYIIDPMRSFHGGEENDSRIEALLASIRRVFRSAVIVPHHMTKRNGNKDAVRLTDDMRLWSDGARGSGAIKAHADVIVCQERRIENGAELVYLGAVLKDGPDIDPIPLEESSAESFFWIPSSGPLKPELQASFEALRKSALRFKNKTDASARIMKETGVSVPTAYRHVSNLLSTGRLREDGKELVIVTANTADQIAPSVREEDQIAPIQ